MVQKISQLIFVAFFFTIFHLTDSFYLAAPSNISVFNKTSTSLLISWEAVANDIIFGYRLRHRPNSTAAFHVNAITDSTSNSSNGNRSCYDNNSSIFVCENRTSVLLTDLQVYTYYWVNVIAFTNETFGNDSRTGVFRTDEGVPTSPPLNITGTKQNSTRITLSWEAVPIQHQRGEIISYVVRVVKSDGGDVTQHNATTRSLDIGDLEKFTLYNITVSASTSKGTSNASSVFQIQTAEDAPDDPPVNINATVVSLPNITSDYITITWDPVVGKLNGILRAYVIRWRPARENASYTEKRVNVKESGKRRRRRSTGDVNNERTFTLTNLSIYTNYSVQVAAFTVKKGVYSTPKYFLSQEGVPLLPPGNVAAVNTSSTVIRVTWSPPEKSSIRGELIGYEITFTPASKNASASQRVMLCTNTSYDLEELSKYTLYNITVAAFTKVGIGNKSKIEQAWTDEDVPDVGPVIVRANSTTFSSINVYWKIIPKEKRNGHITMYEVDVSKEVSGTWETQLTNNFTKNLTAVIHNAVIQNLTMFVKYRIRVRAYTCKGPGPYSNPSKMLMTLETAPSVVPTNLTANPTSRTEVRVTWKIEGLESGFKLRHYVVWYRKVHGENNKTIRSNPNVTEADLTGLSPFTTYEIKVAAATNFTGNFSEPINVTTKEGVPQGAPVNVTAVSKTYSSIRVSWKPVPKEQQNGTITQYNVTVANSTSGQVFRSENVSAWNYSVVIDNLEMYVTYLFKVQAFTKVGPGPFSQSVNGMTIQKDPYVVVNVTAQGISSNSINLTGYIVDIHDQLMANGIRIRYCEMKRNHNNKPDDLDDSCKGCKDKNVSDIDSEMESLTDLRGHTIHRITAQAINIVAKDGTVVRKRYGNESDPIYIETLEREPGAAPSNVTASPHSTTSIKVEWDPVPKCKRNGEITNYIVEVFNSTWGEEVRPANVSSDSRSVVIRGLQEYTNYSVLVYATTAVGEGPPSEYQNTTTHRPAPKTVPENVTAEPTGNSTIRVKWSSIDTSIDGFQGFRVRYEAEGHAEWNDEKETGKIYNITLTKLRMFTTYNIQVAARTTQDGNYSETVSATTWEGVPTEPPNGIDANILETIVEISWGEVPEESRNGEIQGYRITYYKAKNQTYKKTVTNRPDFFTVQLKSLGKFSEYYVEILAYTNAGNGKVGNISFTTSDDIPSKPPRNLKASRFVSPYKIQVTWEPVPPGFMNGRLLSYHVTYQRVMVGGVRKDFEQELRRTVSGSQSVTLDNLEPYSKYKIRVAAKTVKGLGPYTAFTYGETCHCLGRLTTSWRRYAPYVNFTDDGKPGQIIPLVLQSMVKECCGHCVDPNQTVLDFGTNGKNEPSAKNSSRKLLEEMDELTDFTFPVFGHKDQDSYKGGFGYTPVIESAGVAFIVYPDVSTSQTTMFQAMINCLPVFILPIVTAYIAGVIIWCLERKNNPQDFPQSFLEGTWEGVWWSFVSMTTLGYGDRAPLSYKGRIFAIAWILFGLIVIAITMAMITTALTVVSVDSEIKLYGSKIAAEYNSPEYNLGTRRNAKYDPDKEYHSIEEVAEALVNRDVEGVLVDTYAAGLKSNLFDHPPIRVSSVLDYKSAYGIVLSPKSTRLGKCFERYMLSHRAEIFKMIETKVKPIETSSSSSDIQAEEENSGGLLDSGSPTFLKALRYACVMLGLALGLSLVYECIRCMRARQKVRAEEYFKTILLREMQSLVDEFIHRIKQGKAKLGERHRKQIVRFWKLKRKSMCSSGNESEWLRISTASPHRGEVTVTDL